MACIACAPAAAQMDAERNASSWGWGKAPPGLEESEEKEMSVVLADAGAGWPHPRPKIGCASPGRSVARTAAWWMATATSRS